MGLIIKAENADFAASHSDFIWPVLTETADLKALFTPRLNFAGTSRNRATSEKVGSAGQIGSPTYASDRVTVSPDDVLIFNVPPEGINHTMMFTVEMKTGGSLADGIVGATGQDAVTQGILRSTIYNRRVTVQTNCYPQGNSYPSAGGVTLSPYIDLASTYDGNLEVFFAVLQSNVSAKIYHPKTSATFTVAATGKDFGFGSPYAFRSSPSGSATQKVGAFGYWSRALSATQVAATYVEMQTFYARVGVTV